MRFKNNIGVFLFIGIFILLFIKVPIYASALANPIGFMDEPVSSKTLIGIENIRGWFLDQNGVEKIEVLVDGKVAGQVEYGDARPDVLKVFPDYQNGFAGYHFPLDTTKFPDGRHTIQIRETGSNGSVTTLPEKTLTIQNALGFIDQPASGSTLIGMQNVRGWFLDKSGVSKIEVLIDGAVVGEAEYGDLRADVQKVYPEYQNGDAGYHFTLDTTKFPDGKHSLKIRETGANGFVTTLPEKTVTIQNVRGFIDQPASGTTLFGSQNVRGWFLDKVGVSKIEVLLDGVVVGEAVYGDSRADVQKVYSEYQNGDAGYHFTLDTTKFPDGRHTIKVRETGSNGFVTTLPEKTVTFQNVLGYMDQPVSNSALIGMQNVRGWFLNKSGVDKIEVLVDGVVVGKADYGDARGDVLKVYPDYNNGDAGYHYTLDTTQFNDGRHTIQIREIGSNGFVTTLPARIITIQNALGFIDNPISGSTLKGLQNVRGWFLDGNGVKKIEVLVDGAVVGEVTYGDPRPDVLKIYPDYNNGYSGYHFTLDTAKFSDGRHTITIRETGLDGHVTTLPERTVTFSQKTLTVFLDPGHGGYDPGATAGGYREADLNLAVAKKVQTLLLSNGYSVFMSRENDTYVSLLDRSQMANNIPADIFISIHTNSGPTSASGIESYFYEYDPAYPSKINGAMHNNPDRILKSMALTNFIQNNMTQYTGANNRGTDGASFAVIREAAMPATLLEIGFISNGSELQKLYTDAYQNTLARAIADGINEYSRNY